MVVSRLDERYGKRVRHKMIYGTPSFFTLRYDLKIVEILKPSHCPVNSRLKRGVGLEAGCFPKG